MTGVGLYSRLPLCIFEIKMSQEKLELSKLKSKEIEDITSLAQESDEKFVEQSKRMINALPQSLREEAQKFIERITTASKPAFTELVYIPILHNTKELRDPGRELRRDFFKILSDQPKAPTLIAVGDALVPKYTRSALYHSKQKVLAMYQEFGLIRIHRNKIPLDGYEDAVVDFTARNPEFTAIGVDSDIGQLIGTLYLLPNRFPSVGIANTVRFRLGVEGRTRFALSRTSELSKSDQRVIFVQGEMHRKGVETWCQRNSVSMQTIVPIAVKPYQSFD